MKKQRTTIFMVLWVMTLPLFAGTYSGGSGTSTYPYLIANTDDLIELSNTTDDWDAYFKQTGDIIFNNTETTVDWDGDGSSGPAEGFSPIGNGTTEFTGSYDGQNHTIENLFIDCSSKNNVGLFGFVSSGGEVLNVNLTNVKIDGDENVGGLVGTNYEATVSNSSSSGSVNGYSEVGGLVGTNDYGTVSNSSSSGSVNSTVRAGGLVGDNKYGCIVSNSYSSASVTGIVSIGGLVAVNKIGGIVRNSYSTGRVTGSGSRVGGVIGYNFGTVRNSYSTGRVTGDYYVGGLVGYKYSGTVSNSYSTGRVSGNSNVGGLVGYKYGGTVKNSFWNTETSGQTSSAGGTGKTTLEMQTQSTFTNAGWDFMEETTEGSSDYWGMNPNKNSGYPFLAWQGYSHYAAEPTGSPYVITTLNELYWITQNDDRWSNDYIQTIDIDASETSNWNGGAGFLPIGTSSLPMGSSSTSFTGTYNGQGHSIENLFIYRRSKNNVGLFGYVGLGGEILNVNLAGTKIHGGQHVGGLVGYNSGTVNTSYSSGNVNGSGSRIGGLVAVNDGKVSKSYSSASVTGDYYVGGLVGDNYIGSIVDNSYSSGSVTGSGSRIGGLAGYNYGTVSNSYSTGNVDGDDAVGGLLGGTSGTVSNSYSTGEVDGSTDVGGLVGHKYSGTVKNSFWDTDTSNQPGSAGGTGKTSAEMQDYNTFTDENTSGLTSAWDFVTNPNDETGDDDYWDMDQLDTVNNGYPILSWQDGADDILVYSGGNGTSGNPYLIANTDDLIELSNTSGDWGAYFEQTGEITFNNTEKTVDWDGDDSADWDAEDQKGFSPIGNEAIKFTGTYDGQNHTIENLYINRSITNFVGLFGYVGLGGDIRNVKLSALSIHGDRHVGGLVGQNEGTVDTSSSSGNVTGSSHLGGLVGTNYDANVSNSYSTGSVKGSSRLGGLVGMNYSSSVSNSYSTGSITGNTEVGGLVGYNWSGTVNNSYSTGNMTGSSHPGGLVGYSSGPVSNSFWDVNTSGLGSSGDDNFGATGKTTAEMQDYNTFTDKNTSGLTSAWDFVTDPNDDAVDNDYWDMDQLDTVNKGYPILSWQDGADNMLKYSGGSGTSGDPYLIATTDDLIELSNTSGDWGAYFKQTANISFNAVETQVDWDGDGNPDGSGASGFSPIGPDHTNGFTGSYDGQNHTIDNLYINRSSTYFVGLFGYLGSAGEILNVNLTNATIEGNKFVAALVGESYAGTVSNSSSSGIVSGVTRVGGLVGVNQNGGTVSSSYSSVNVTGSGDYVGGLVGSNYGPVSNTYCSGSVDGGTNVGGLVGYTYVSSGSTGTVRNSYSTASVTGSSNVGGLIGRNQGTVNNSFWNTETPGLKTSAGGTGKTTAEMQQIGTYTLTSTTGLTSAWDFIDNPNDDSNNENYWGINPAENDGYPFLAWQGYSQNARPTVLTENVTDIKACRATGNGDINYLGTTNPDHYGVCWNTTGSPSTADNSTDEGTISSTGAFTSDITGLEGKNTYYVRAYATNDAGTNYGSEVSFTTTPPLLIDNVTSTNTTAYDVNDGKITITASGSITPYEYSINGGSTWQSDGDYDGLAPRNYTVMAKDANGCVTEYPDNPVSISEPEPLVINNVDVDEITCHDASDGRIEIDADGGAGQLQYSIDEGNNWFNGDLFIMLGPGSYNIRVKDQNDNTVAYTGNPATLTNPPELMISDVTASDPSCYGSSDGQITISASDGSEDIMYSIDGGASWQDNGTFASLPAGDYEVTVKGANGCITTYASNPLTLAEPPQLTIDQVDATDVTCHGSADGTISITATGGSGTLLYSINEGQTWQRDPQFTGLTPGSYTVEVKDHSDCQAAYTSNPVTITQPESLVITDVLSQDASQYGAGDGQITVTATGGTPPHLYSIDGGATWQSSGAFDDLAAGSYTAGVKDHSDCTAEYADNPVVVDQPLLIAVTGVTHEDVSGCYGGANGSITIEAEGTAESFFYSIDGGGSWHDNGGVFEYLMAGEYEVMVKDANENTATYTDNPVTLSQPDELVIGQVAATDVTCHGNGDGTITITASGGSGALMYTINDGQDWQQDPQFTGLTPGSYTVVVKDQSDCQAAYEGNPVEITQPDALVITGASAEDASGYDQSDGSITITAEGGIAPYQYSINGGGDYQMGDTFTDLAPGDYQVQVKDANGCISAYPDNPVTIGWPPEQTTLEGQVRFFNAGESPFPAEANLKVALVDDQGNLSQVQQVGPHPGEASIAAFYRFNGVAPGQSYTIRVWEDAQTLGDTWQYNNWNGITSADALIIAYMVTGNPNVAQLPWILPQPGFDYTPLFTDVADVNNSGSLTGLDALLLGYRLVGFPGTSPFPNNNFDYQVGGQIVDAPGDMTWDAAPEEVFTQNGTYQGSSPGSSVYYEGQVIPADEQTVFNIYWVTTGDVNASYTPGSGSAKSREQLAYKGHITAEPGAEITIPVTTSRPVEAGALTLGLSYDNTLMEVTDAEGYEVKYINHEKGFTRVSMVNPSLVTFDDKNPVVKLKARLLRPISPDARYMELENRTEMVDGTAWPIHDITYQVPRLRVGNTTSISEMGGDKLEHTCYPNPFDELTTINYTLPVEGKVIIDVFDNLGRRVKRLKDSYQSAGQYDVRFDQSDARGAGIYTYRILVKGRNKTYLARGVMILVK